MCSVSDEVIPLVRPISTVKARGQVDKWLAELEIQMRLSLRQQIDNALKVYLETAIIISLPIFFLKNFLKKFLSIIPFCLKQEYPSKDILESVDLFPTQAILCSDFITWTAKLETVINDSGGQGM